MIYQQLVNFNHAFNALKSPPIIINDLVNNSEEDREIIRELITSRYTGDMVSLLPSCRCGESKGEFSIGIQCAACGTTVKSTLEDEIEPAIWFRRPSGVNRLINPHVWTMLKNRFKKSGFSVIQWICDTTYRPNVKVPAVIQKLIDAGIPRGYNAFVDNFDQTMQYLFDMKDFQLKKGQIDYLRDLLATQRAILFSDYIPLPNKSLLIIEHTNLGVYVDPIIVGAVDAIEMLVSIDTSFHDQTSRVKENRTIKAVSKLAEFYEHYFKSNLAPKLGQLRRHIYGTRTNFSFRAVISSMTDTHDYDEIHVPWGIGLTAFRPHLLNKLARLGYDNNSAVGMLLSHVEQYHPLLDRLLQELITETRGGGGISCILQRN